MSSGQLWAAVAVIVIGHTIALLYQTHYVDKRIEDLGKRLDDVRDLLRAEMATLRTELRGEMAALRTELRGEIATLRAEMAALRAEVRGEFAEFKAEVQRELAKG